MSKAKQPPQAGEKIVTRVIYYRDGETVLKGQIDTTTAKGGSYTEFKEGPYTKIQWKNIIIQTFCNYEDAH